MISQEKTEKATRREIVSSYRNSNIEWDNRVKMNKTIIYEKDEEAKDKIMRSHLDMRLKNNNAYKINEKMTTLRHQANKLAQDFN